MELIIPASALALFAAVFVVVRSKRGNLELRLAKLTARRGRALDATPIVTCPEAAIVRVIGAVGSHGKPMMAPISKLPCVYWRLTIAYWESDGRQPYWREIYERTRRDPFVLAEPAATCLVDPASATMQIGGTSTSVVRRDGRWRRAIVELVQSDQQLGRTIRDREVRIVETIIACGDRIAVVGAAHHDERTAPARLCVNAKLISNDPTLLHARGRRSAFGTPPSTVGTRGAAHVGSVLDRGANALR